MEVLINYGRINLSTSNRGNQKPARYSGCNFKICCAGVCLSTSLIQVARPQIQEIVQTFAVDGLVIPVQNEKVNGFGHPCNVLHMPCKKLLKLLKRKKNPLKNCAN